jgi:cell division protein FtsZ
MHEIRTSIVGVGGAGCKVIDRVAGLLREEGTTVAVNTDARSLEACRATSKLQIGTVHTRGFGAGGDVELGRMVAEDDLDMIRGLFFNVDLVFVVAGLGGGTGTGAAPVILQAARDAGALTLCFATLPFAFEGHTRRTEADRAVSVLRRQSDALVLVPNDRLSGAVGETQLAKAFEVADDVLGAGIVSLWRLVSRPGYIRVDFADLQKAVRSSGGACSLGYGEGRGENRARAAAAALLDSPLLDHGRLMAESEAMIVCVAGGPDLTIKDVELITEAITARARKDSHILVGTTIDDEWTDRVCVTVLASEQWTSGPTAPASPRTTSFRDQLEPSGEDGGRRKKRPIERQIRLRFDAYGKGRFKDAEPTILDGEDMDIPTFVRRGITIEK